MARRYKPKVLYDGAVLEGLIGDMREQFPFEGGGFLLADPRYLGTELWHIRDYTQVVPRKRSRSSFCFEVEDLLKAHRYALMRGLIFGGFFHSHPWKRPPLCMTHHSHADEELQQLYDFPLSLVVGISTEGWSITTWRNHSSAPAHHLLVWQGKRYNLPSYLKLAHAKNHPIWSRHLSLTP